MNIEKKTGWKFRNDEITMKQFYNLSQQDRDEYIQYILDLKPDERSSMDEILLNRFNTNKEDNNFFTIKSE
jgi:hypothetical protein